jgi:hypothetical protein
MLEATGSLTPPNWQPVIQEPALVGARWTVTEALSDAGRFYRLRSPE